MTNDASTKVIILGQEYVGDSNRAIAVTQQSLDTEPFVPKYVLVKGFPNVPVTPDVPNISGLLN